MGVDKAPLSVLFFAAIHEVVEEIKKAALRNDIQFSLPNSAPVVSELWRDLTETRHYLHSVHSVVKLWCVLIREQVVSPDVVIPSDIADSWSAVVRLRFRPVPAMALLNRYCTPYAVQDKDQSPQQILDRCPLFKRFVQRIAEIYSSDLSEQVNQQIDGFAWDQLPSFRKLRELVRKHAKSTTPIHDEDTPFTKAPHSGETGEALLAALLCEPVIEMFGAWFDRFETRIFVPITERVDQVLGLPDSLMPSLASPLNSLTAADVGPTGSVKNLSETSERNSEVNGIDFDALSQTLLRDGQVLPSKLVGFMKHRTIATFQDDMDNVHGQERNEGTVRTLINRTNNALSELKSRLRFSTKACQVIRHIDPE